MSCSCRVDFLCYLTIIFSLFQSKIDAEKSKELARAKYVHKPNYILSYKLTVNHFAPSNISYRKFISHYKCTSY